jgi:hypothetical protein
MGQIVDLLLASGFAEAGTTRVDNVRIPTTRSPVFGHGATMGGERATFGGRLRFARGKQRVTVGRYTTSFYTTLDDTSRQPCQNFVTLDVQAIRHYLGALPQPEGQG